MRQPLLIANWKMHKTVLESIAYARELGLLVKTLEGIDVVVAPPFTALAAVGEATRPTPVMVAAQDVAAEREGAFTGEVSAAMIKDAGAEFVIVGHSERRRLFGETDALVNQKTRTVLAEGLTPIVCVGETIEERERGGTLAVLDRQLSMALETIEGAAVASIVIAYEPVWAIGTGHNATPAEAGDAHAHIRSRVREWRGAAAADGCRIVYGGSVKPDNIHELASLSDVDGALVGGASLDVRTFFDIVSRSKMSPG